ncbi:MAG: carboxypeptidase regulatory-like domain-containing protein [Planctomycetaceae bacterium]|nr:carboxypeptidase regulatory-like domain-containing protein [Planctomycetaceae bacterium]
MKIHSRFARAICLMTTWAVLLPAPEVFAEAASTTTPVVADITLQDGLLHGRLVTPEGTAIAGVTVRLLREQQILAQATTDATGAYSFAGLRAGVYRLETATGGATVRVWSAAVAPPSSVESFTLVEGEVVRGQFEDLDRLHVILLGLGTAGLVTGTVGIARAESARRVALRAAQSP